MILQVLTAEEKTLEFIGISLEIIEKYKLCFICHSSPNQTTSPMHFAGYDPPHSERFRRRLFCLNSLGGKLDSKLGNSSHSVVKREDT